MEKAIKRWGLVTDSPSLSFSFPPQSLGPPFFLSAYVLKPAAEFCKSDRRYKLCSGKERAAAKPAGDLFPFIPHSRVIGGGQQTGDPLF